MARPFQGVLSSYRTLHGGDFSGIKTDMESFTLRSTKQPECPVLTQKNAEYGCGSGHLVPTDSSMILYDSMISIRNVNPTHALVGLTVLGDLPHSYRPPSLTARGSLRGRASHF